MHLLQHLVLGTLLLQTQYDTHKPWVALSISDVLVDYIADQHGTWYQI